MKTILEQITAHKREEIILRKKLYPVEILEQSKNFSIPAISIKTALRDKNKAGIIAEFKRRSPSKGNINILADVTKTTQGYVEAGASALSVLTDKDFFGGCEEDFLAARAANNCPILRKDFIIDEYQVLETKAMGADVILLIAAILSPSETKKLAALAKQVGLEVLLEIHTEKELNRLNDYVDLVGVNNRNLNDFSVSIEQSIRLFDSIPTDFIKISESGIDTAEKLLLLKHKGFQGFLMGEKFMNQENPEEACRNFIASVNKEMVKTSITGL